MAFNTAGGRGQAPVHTQMGPNQQRGEPRVQKGEERTVGTLSNGQAVTCGSREVTV